MKFSSAAAARDLRSEPEAPPAHALGTGLLDRPVTDRVGLADGPRASNDEETELGDPGSMTGIADARAWLRSIQGNPRVSWYAGLEMSGLRRP